MDREIYSVHRGIMNGFIRCIRSLISDLVIGAVWMMYSVVVVRHHVRHLHVGADKSQLVTNISLWCNQSANTAFIQGLRLD